MAKAKAKSPIATARRDNRKPREKPFPYAVTFALAKCVYFALAHRKRLHLGGMRAMELPDGTKVYDTWEETFMQALDLVGYHVDRKAFWNSKPTKKGKRR